MPKSSLGPVRTTGDAEGQSIRRQVYEQLREAILSAELLPGSTVSENELASTLHVSRTPLREAIQRLRSEGLIRVVPQVGTFIEKLDLSHICDALFMREAVECAAMARLASALPEDALQGLEEIVAAHHRAIDENDVAATMMKDAEFHRALFELAGVPGVWRYVIEAREMHRRVRILSRAERRFDATRRSANHHLEILRELAAGRPDCAIAKLREHVRMNVQFAIELAEMYPEYFTEQRAPSYYGQWN
jgi:DNA-binding GntR family transcriptional regulator